MHIYLTYLAQNFSTTLELPENSTIQDAVNVSKLYELYPQAMQLKCGIYSKIKSLDTILREHDRVEIYSPLIADPKLQRQKRVEKKRLADKQEQQKWKLRKHI